MLSEKPSNPEGVVPEKAAVAVHNQISRSEKMWEPELLLRLFAGILASWALGMIVVSGYASFTKNKTDLFVFFAGMFSFHVVGLVLVNVFLRQHRMTWSEAFGFREPRLARALFLAVMTVIVMLPIALSLMELSARFLHYFHHPIEPQQAVKMMQGATSHTELVMQGIATLFLAPFVEELLFRGIFYTGLKQHISPKAALWGTSLVFAISHQSLVVFLPLTVLAIVLTFLYETTNNLLAPVAAHSLFNAANYAFLLFQKYQQGLL